MKHPAKTSICKQSFICKETRLLLQDSPKKAVSCLQLFEDGRGLPPEQAILVRCLLCRAAYGGMTGDIELLKGMSSIILFDNGGFGHLEDRSKFVMETFG